MVTFLTKDDIIKSAPSAFATQPHAFMSDRYVMVPTEQIIDQMHDAGWGVVSAKQPNTYGGKRTAANKKHLIEFESYNRTSESRILAPLGRWSTLAPSSPTPAMARLA